MRILVVEDDLRLLELLVEILNRAGFTVDTSRDGDDAFEKLRKNKYEVIVLDLMLPKKSGVEVISSARALGNNTPILVVSARSMTEDRVSVLNLGADDYLVKNFSTEELVARIKALMRRKSATKRSNILKCQDLVLNISDMSISRNGKDIYLSKKEAGILIELLRHKNNLVTRKQIIQAVWGERDADILSNTIDVHIRMLRNKVDKPFENTIIKTIRGRGYIAQEQE